MFIFTKPSQFLRQHKKIVDLVKARRKQKKPKESVTVDKITSPPTPTYEGIKTREDINQSKPLPQTEEKNSLERKSYGPKELDEGKNE